MTCYLRLLSWTSLPKIPSSRHMTANEVFKTAHIASSARIVIEMKNEQSKNFRCLQGIISLSEAHLAEQMAFIRFAWTNWYPPPLKWDVKLAKWQCIIPCLVNGTVINKCSHFSVSWGIQWLPTLYSLGEQLCDDTPNIEGPQFWQHGGPKVPISGHYLDIHALLVHITKSTHSVSESQRSSCENDKKILPSLLYDKYYTCVLYVVQQYGVIFCTNYPVINGHLLTRTGILL